MATSSGNHLVQVISHRLIGIFQCATGSIRESLKVPHISTAAFVRIPGITFHVLERCRGPVPCHFVCLKWSGPNFLLWPDLVMSAFSTGSFLHTLRIRILSLVCETQWRCMISYAIIVPSNSHHVTGYVLLFINQFFDSLALQYIRLYSSHQLVKKILFLLQSISSFFSRKSPPSLSNIAIFNSPGSRRSHGNNAKFKNREGFMEN
ncbi:hypothetical protein AVEN_15646-1 [Araneus ventricosus]|uniref:Uncharacterized protein n=1 Tax=Araneus ventricosus TaxID=182803 RepID=A0A4Y2QAP8_ARAVE|nr:hypothetical protein AVEN_76902-1 [Araneus ventricosus]GBN60566.1 hypothetical protein AVEN_15646-1 [Araneus ventricosus]